MKIGQNVNPYFTSLLNHLYLMSVSLSNTIKYWWRFCVVTLLFGFFCRCRGFCHRTESDRFLLLFTIRNDKSVY